MSLCNNVSPDPTQAFGTIGAMFGGIVAWPVSDHFGRKAALIVGGMPFLCGWLLIANAVQITQSRAGFLAILFSGRLLAGFSTGWSIFCASVSIFIFIVTNYNRDGLFVGVHSRDILSQMERLFWELQSTLRDSGYFADLFPWHQVWRVPF